MVVQRQCIWISCRSGNVIKRRSDGHRGMVVRAAVRVDVLRDDTVFVNVHYPQAVLPSICWFWLVGSALIVRLPYRPSAEIRET